MGKLASGKACLKKETIRRLSPAMLSMAVGGEQDDPKVEPSHYEQCAVFGSPDRTRTDGTNTCAF